MFDQRTMEEEAEAYIDLDKNLYGYKAKNTKEGFDSLEYIVTQAPKNSFYEKAVNYFDYFDKENCRRLADKIFGSKA